MEMQKKKKIYAMIFVWIRQEREVLINEPQRVL